VHAPAAVRAPKADKLLTRSFKELGDCNVQVKDACRITLNPANLAEFSLYPIVYSGGRKAIPLPA
jgi:hypothetical protein